MIISDEYKFVFVHIPKCAGTSVRNRLQSQFRIDPRFSGTQVHPELGRIDMAHMPLSVLRQHFITEYQKIKTYEAFAVVRDPFDRFPSSMFQRLKMFGEVPAEVMTRRAFAKAVDETIASLSSFRTEELLSYDYIHFQKQHSFVYDDDVQIVSTLFPLQDVSRLFEHVGRLIGPAAAHTEVAGVSHENRSEFFRSDFLSAIASRVMPFYTPSVKKRLPGRLRKALNSLLIVSQSERFQDVFESNHVKQFIRDYYSEDIELFENARSQRTPRVP